MNINASKNQLIVLGIRAMLRSLTPITIRVGNTPVTESKMAKNLGLVSDRHLTFETHIDQLTTKCTGMLIGLIHARHIVPSCALQQVLESLVISSIRYCISVYGTLAHVELRKCTASTNFSTSVLVYSPERENTTESPVKLSASASFQPAAFSTTISCLVQSILRSADLTFYALCFTMSSTASKQGR